MPARRITTFTFGPADYAPLLAARFAVTVARHDGEAARGRDALPASERRKPALRRIRGAAASATGAQSALARA